MTEFEEASAKYTKARDAYWLAERDLANARHELAMAERVRRAAFDKEIDAARSRHAVSSQKDSGNG